MGIAEFGANIGSSTKQAFCCGLLTILALLVPVSVAFQWVVYIDHKKMFENFGCPS
jgi:hypothetical protein